MKITMIITLAGLMLIVSQARSAMLVTASRESAVIARETDGIWEVGRTNLVSRALPTGLLAGNSWKSLDAGDGHGLVVDGEGVLFSWGSNGSSFPLPLGADRDWRSVSAGGGLSTAIKANGSLWAWGAAIPGEPASVQSNVPLAVGSILDWKSTATGSNHRLALRTDGSLWAWGYNSHGTLGDGTYINRLAPVRVGTANDWASIACGVYTSFALKTDGSLWIWGNIFGTGSSPNLGSDVPVQLGSQSDWRAIYPSSSKDYVLAIKLDGSLWSWGGNSSGVLGLGDTTPRLSPVRVGTAVDWSEVAPGDLHVVATKVDGSIWHWGSLSGTQIPQSSTPVNRSSLYTPKPQMRVFSEGRGTMTSGATWTLKTAILTEPDQNQLRIYNDGLVPLLISSVSLPSGFTLDATPSVVPPINFVNCQVRLVASAKGLFSGAAHIFSNHPDLPDFTLNLSGRVLSPQDDSDSDGMNDAAEVALSALGFDWNYTQTSMVETLRSKAEFAGFVPASKIFDIQLHTVAPVIDSIGGTALLRIGLRNPANGTSLPLETEALQGPNASGIKLDFSVPIGCDFIRIRR